MYPSCMMGGGGCSYMSDCEKEDQERYRRKEEKRQLDLEEQRLRIAILKKELGNEPVSKG